MAGLSLTLQRVRHFGVPPFQILQNMRKVYGTANALMKPKQGVLLCPCTAHEVGRPYLQRCCLLAPEREMGRPLLFYHSSCTMARIHQEHRSQIGCERVGMCSCSWHECTCKHAAGLQAAAAKCRPTCPIRGCWDEQEKMRHQENKMQLGEMQGRTTKVK